MSFKSPSQIGSCSQFQDHTLYMSAASTVAPTFHTAFVRLAVSMEALAAVRAHSQLGRV